LNNQEIDSFFTKKESEKSSKSKENRNNETVGINKLQRFIEFNKVSVIGKKKFLKNYFFEL